MNAASYVLGVRESDALRPQNSFESWFPVPQVLVPKSCGIDISDSSLKVLSLKRGPHGGEVDSFAQGSLNAGIVVNGLVKDPPGLARVLKELMHEAGSPHFAHLALPEESAYIFMMHVPDVHDRAQACIAIEFEFEGRIPLKPEQTVYDFDIVQMHHDGKSAEIAVAVFPREVIDGYATACELAGITLVSAEVEAHSIARTIIDPQVKSATLIVDFGRARTGIAIVQGQVPIFTTTVEVGGNSITKIIQERLSVDEAQAENYKNEQGINLGKDQKVTEIITATAAALTDEIVRHYQYWDSRRDENGNRVTPIERIFLTGGSSNLKGLPGFISGKVKAPTTRAQVWRNVCSFDEYIPSIPENHALGLSTVIGLALRGL